MSGLLKLLGDPDAAACEGDLCALPVPADQGATPRADEAPSAAEPPEPQPLG